MDDRLGKVVYSKSGRDRGRMFVIVEVVNESFVLIADGDLRKIENPKVKNVKHLVFTTTRADVVMAYLDRSEIPPNHVIRKNLRSLQGSGESDGKEVW